MRRYILAALAVAVASGMLARSEPAGADRPRGLRVLFVGNSYTRFNDLPSMVHHVAESDPQGRPIAAARHILPGANLRRHWRRVPLRRAIADGEYDVVVLQGHSLGPFRPSYEPSQYTERFSQVIAQGRARAVYFETWARGAGSSWYSSGEVGSGPDEMQHRIRAFYTALAARFGGHVAPVGSAFLRAARDVPDVPMHLPDGTHPAPAGTYVAALVIYATVTGRDPRAVTWSPHRMSRQEGTRLRALAAASVGP